MAAILYQPQTSNPFRRAMFLVNVNLILYATANTKAKEKKDAVHSSASSELRRNIDVQLFSFYSAFFNIIQSTK